MGRPRAALWESDDNSIYLTTAGDAFVVIDTCGSRREHQRVRLDDALDLARSLASGVKPRAREMTLFGLAEHYFDHGLPIWEDGSGIALAPNTIADRRGMIANHYAFVGTTPLSEIPDDVLRHAVERLRARGGSKSLEDKVLGIGRSVLAHGAAIGVIPHTRHFPGPIRRRRRMRIDQEGRVGRVTRPLPSHREVHRFARLSAETAGAEYMRLFWWIAAYVGLRVGELCALTVDDVHIAGRVHLDVTKKVTYHRGVGQFVEHFAKCRKHRTVTIPTLLAPALLARVAEVRAEGRTLLFPRWRRGPEGHISYNALQDHFCQVGAQIGWTVTRWQEAATYCAADGRTRNYRAKPSSLEYSIHDLRAFAATTMYDYAGGGIRLRGMRMDLHAVAKQMGDTPEVVKDTYLGILEGNAAVLDREVP